MDKPAAFSGPLTFLPKGQSEVSCAPVLERPWAFCGQPRTVVQVSTLPAAAKVKD